MYLGPIAWCVVLLLSRRESRRVLCALVAVESLPGRPGRSRGREGVGVLVRGAGGEEALARLGGVAHARPGGGGGRGRGAGEGD